MQVGCYSLDMYCDAQGCPDRYDMPHTYTAELGTTCRRRARKDGWSLSSKGDRCPKCVKGGRRLPPEKPEYESEVQEDTAETDTS